MLICKLDDLKSGNCFRSEFIGKDQTGREDIYAKSVVVQRMQHGSADITEELNIQKQTLKSINWLFLLLSEIVKYYQKD